MVSHLEGGKCAGQCVICLFAYFDVSWVVHGGPVHKFHARVGMPGACRGAKATCRLPVDGQLFAMGNVDHDLPNQLPQHVFCGAF